MPDAAAQLKVPAGVSNSMTGANGAGAIGKKLCTGAAGTAVEPQ